MSRDMNQDLIDALELSAQQSDEELQKNIHKLLNIYQEQKKEISKAKKQNDFFIKQWDKRNILAHETNSKKDKMLEQQSKMAAMGEMMDAVAHQWKQPLNAMSMLVDMLDSDYNDKLVNDAYIEDLTSTAHTQIEHMLSTLNEFRKFFRPSHELTTDFYLEKCIDSVQVLMKDELIIHNLILYIDIEEDLIINGRENEFKHLFINLINNSIDAFEDKEKMKSRDVFIRAYKENSKTYIEFEDNAGGIPEHIIATVFKPNVTTKEDGKGTGIGLYMSSQIVQKHQGKINIYNSKMGAFFTIILN